MGFVLVFLILLVIIGIPLLLGQVAMIVIALLIPAVTIYVVVRSWGYTKGWEAEKRKVVAKRAAFSTYLLFGLLLAISVIAGNTIGESGSGWELAKKVAQVTGIISIGGTVLFVVSLTPLWVGYTSGIRFCRWMENLENPKRTSPNAIVKLPLISLAQHRGNSLQLAYGIVGAITFCCLIVVAPFFIVLTASWIFQLPPSHPDATIKACLMGGVPVVLLAVNTYYIHKSLAEGWLPICTNEVIEALGDIISVAFNLVFGKT